MFAKHVLADDHGGVAFSVATAQRPDGRDVEQRRLNQLRVIDGNISADRDGTSAPTRSPEAEGAGGRSGARSDVIACGVS